MVDNAGRRPRPPGSSNLRLSLAEREEISRGLAAGLSLRATAACGPAAPCAAPRRGPRAGYATSTGRRLAEPRTCVPERSRTSAASSRPSLTVKC
jgi:transposase, IS30 family